MTNAKKFRLIFYMFIASVILYKTIYLQGLFYKNPLYFSSLFLGGWVVLSSITYFCPKCSKNQIIKGMVRFRLPTDHCWNCGCDLNNRQK